MSITMCSEALPSPLPLEETVTLLRPVTETMAGSTPPSLILHQDVGKKPRRLFSGRPFLLHSSLKDT